MMPKAVDHGALRRPLSSPSRWSVSTPAVRLTVAFQGTLVEGSPDWILHMCLFHILIQIRMDRCFFVWGPHQLGNLDIAALPIGIYLCLCFPVICPKAIEGHNYTRKAWPFTHQGGRPSIFRYHHNSSDTDDPWDSLITLFCPYLPLLSWNWIGRET